MIAWMRVMELVLCSASSQSLSSPPLQPVYAEEFDERDPAYAPERCKLKMM